MKTFAFEFEINNDLDVRTSDLIRHIQSLLYLSWALFGANQICQFLQQISRDQL